MLKTCKYTYCHDVHDNKLIAGSLMSEATGQHECDADAIQHRKHAEHDHDNSQTRGLQEVYLVYRCDAVIRT
jgi:hypothetical protein